MKHKVFTLTTMTALVSTMALADINPKDGTWKTKLGSSKVTGCPSMMTAMINKQSIKEQTKRVDFDEPFHPKSLFEESEQLKWEKTAANKWRAVMHQGGGGGDVNIVWTIDVVSPTKMNVSSKVSMKFPPQMAAMFGGSSECKAHTTGSYNYIGN